MIKLFLLLLCFVKPSIQYLQSFFNHWHCIAIKQNINPLKPIKVNIGELPLVLWKGRNEKEWITTLNICKHMGSQLDNGIITSNSFDELQN